MYSFSLVFSSSISFDVLVCPQAGEACGVQQGPKPSGLDPQQRHVAVLCSPFQRPQHWHHSFRWVGAGTGRPFRVVETVASTDPVAWSSSPGQSLAGTSSTGVAWASRSYSAANV